MEKHVVYKPKGVCSQRIEFDLVDGVVHNVKFIGGCAGNTQGVASLAEGMQAEDLANRLDGIICRGGTSCPSQFAKAIKQALEENA